MPSLPLLAVLPERWMKGSRLLGGSIWITRSISGKSNPLAQTFVVTNTFKAPRLKLRKAYSRLL